MPLNASPSSNQKSPNLVNPMLTPRIVWGALVLSTFMYYSILVQKGTGAPTGDGDLMILPLSIVAAVVFILSFVVPEFILKAQARRLQRPLELQKLVSISLVPLVIRMAFAESVCIFGLLLGLRNGIQYFYPFWAASLLSMLLAFPSEAKLRAKAEQYVPNRSASI